MVEENAGSTRSFLADGGEVENWNDDDDDDDDDDDKCENFWFVWFCKRRINWDETVQ